ncbi:MAG: response regulator [Nannocystaceae bacterium]|jgi:DNA-binding NtrC family response regulator
MTPGSVLIVDDNQDLAENLGEALEVEGFECAIAHDGDSAIAKLEDRPFDLVITDLRMTPRDGIAVVQAVRSRSATTPVVLMTAFAGEVQLDQARKAGVTALVAKPVDTSRLVALVREQLDGPAEP